MLEDPRKRQQIHQLSRSQVKSYFPNLDYLEEIGKNSVEQALAALTPRQRDFVEHWRAIVERSDVEVANLFVQCAPKALRVLDFDGVEAWLFKALEQFDQRGLGWAVEVLHSVEQFAQTRSAGANSLALNDVSVLLARFVTGLGGRELRIDNNATAYTDTETLFLPNEITIGDYQDNFRLYKAMAVHHWAQTWYGTWRLSVLDALLSLPQASQPLIRFAALERLRLDACIARDLPGVYRDMLQLQEQCDEIMPFSKPWQEAAEAMSEATADALDSCRWTAQLGSQEPPAPACYHGVFNLNQVQAKLSERMQREREGLRLALGSLQQKLDQNEAEAGPSEDNIVRNRKPTEGFSLEQSQGESSSRVAFQLRLEGQSIALPDDTKDLLGSICQDIGEVPEDYLDTGSGLYDAEYAGSGVESGQTWTGYNVGVNQLLRYPEWDYTRQRFRPDYCTLREYTVSAGDPAFVPDTVRKYRGLLKSIRRSFEAMIGESRLERRQPNGDDIDLDALVEAHADAHHGEELNEAVYTRSRNNARSIAVMFMVDMSGSTKGWVVDAEREALVLLCEALETIGDRYAIYGFSGRTHQRVDIYHIKRFEEAYHNRVKGRISGIQPRAYTRMGAPIRHLGGLLKQVPARHKLLITLSDGKPEDYGSYYGKYGIEDTRHALLELRRAGVHPYCITLDREGGDYLPYMYGAANFACIDEVYKLPLKVADIYRKLTT